MDSIYEIPRTAPVPASAQKIPAIPVVPEVSMIFQNNAEEACSPVDSMYLSYNAWKARNQNATGAGAKPNHYMDYIQHIEPQKSALGRQVRFESPPMKPPCTLPRNSAQLQNSLPNSNVQNCNAIKPKFTKPFEQIYMANVPNRHLDLSIIEPPKTIGGKGNLENISPNINLSSNPTPTKRYQNPQTIFSDTNVPSYFNKKSKFSDCSQYTNNWPAARNTLPNESLKHNTEKVKDFNMSGITEKNRIVDMYNYNRDGLRTLNSDYAQRHTLDNTKHVENFKRMEVNAQKGNLCAPPNVYESFTSHNCATNKCTCKCIHNGNVKCNTAIQTGANLNTKSSEEPTAKDLLKIIQQQNDQILLLQKQVAALLSRDVPKQIEAPPVTNRNINMFGEQYQTSTQLETQENLCNPAQKFLPKKGPLQQFSMDVMTSFEVSIRPQNVNRACMNVLNHQPKITEITETDSSHSRSFAAANPVGNVLDGIRNNNGRINDTFKNTDVSLTFNEPVRVPETCPSPVNSVEIHMNDYSYDSDQEDPADAGWTLYNNMMQQVNHILKKSGIQPSNSPPLNVDANPGDSIKHNMMKKVKEATVKHLKSIGVHVPAMDDTDDSVENNPHNRMVHNPNEVSFAVKQLLMKYLPDEQLAKITYMKENAPPVESPGFIKRRPEFSFATVQYMQKYNLLNDNSNQPSALQQNEDFDRILDVTAIKQQPKLL